ncbi:MAG TPA: competence/damage-inducible protein A [Gemmatimonadales bacterium]|jgi:nicotinamide-nucleotide amidase
MDAEILTIGTELVLGFTVNGNAAVMGSMLAGAGVRVRRTASVVDEPELIAEAVKAALERCGTVIISGGLGPTRDDMTRESVARVFGTKLNRDPAIVERLRDWYKGRGVLNMPEANLVQADVPEGATVLENALGTAPGLWIESNGHLAVLLPGVPKELKALMESQVIPRLQERVSAGAPTPGAPRTVIRSRTLRSTGIGESAIADILGDYQKQIGEKVSLAFLPSTAGTDLRFTVWDLPEGEASGALEHAGSWLLSTKIGTRIYGEGNTDIAAVVLDKLAAEEATLSVAESCTGGLLGARLTAIPGSSMVFVGGVVAYENDIKLQLLGVSADDLTTHGAVSEEVARQMASGVRRATDSDAAIAITGIAGPDGGSADKPVGTVWIAISWRDAERAFHLQLPGDRQDVRERAAQYALDYLRRILAGTV